MWLIAALVTAVLTYYFINRLLRSLKVDFAGKYVFITGCDSGFGNLLSIRLSKLGFHVIAGCLTQASVDALSQLCPERLSATLLDVTSEESIQKAYKHVKEALPRGSGLWALVNNAGVSGQLGNIEMCSRQDFVDALDVNLYGPIQMTKTFLPLVRQSQGRVVCITSVMGRYPGVNAPYCVSKFGFEAFCDILRREVYRQGIKVSILEPGYFKTNILNYDDIMKKMKACYNNSSDEVKAVYGAEFVKNHEKIVSETLRRASTETDLVVDAYVHAITAKFPKTRYVVGNDAKFFFVPLSFMPDWLGDWIIRRMMNSAIDKN